MHDTWWVSAIDANKVVVNFNTAIGEVDHTNFTLSDGVTVVKATQSADKKSVTLELNKNLTAEMEYVVTASGIVNAKGTAAEGDLTGKVTFSIQEEVSIALDKATYVEGETAKLTVTDKDGKVITPLNTVIESSNTNVFANDLDAVAEGTADVTVTVTLNDQTVVVKTFSITVEKEANVVSNQGFTLETDLATTAANTAEFNSSTKVTSLYNGDSYQVAMFDTKNSDPEKSHVDFTDATVKSLNPTIAIAEITKGVLTVTADDTQTGKASFEVTFKDKTKRTFTVDVLATPVLKDIAVDTTSVKLSDESVVDATEGVDQKTVEVSLVDQYGEDFPTAGFAGKVTVVSNTEGLEILESDGLGGFAALTDNELDITTNDKFIIKSVEDKLVSGKVTVSYFAKDTDTKPTSTKTITVSVVDVDSAATPASIDVVAPTAIDVNGTVNEVNYGTSTVYVLDTKGNRIDSVSVDSTSLVDPKNSWVDLAANVLSFVTGAEDYMSESGTQQVKVTASGITVTETVNLSNSAVVPHKVAVSSKPVAIKLDSADTGITLEEILFGTIDDAKMVKDDFLADGTTPYTVYMAVKDAATNSGYLYNTPLVSVTSVKGASVALGSSIYGLDYSKVLDVNSFWNGNVWNCVSEVTFDVADKDDNVGFTIANWSTADGISAPTALTDEIALSEGDTVTFTLVVKAIKVTGDTSDDANLLAAPVSINVTLTK